MSSKEKVVEIFYGRKDKVLGNVQERLENKKNQMLLLDSNICIMCLFLNNIVLYQFN